MGAARPRMGVTLTSRRHSPSQSSTASLSGPAKSVGGREDAVRSHGMGRGRNRSSEDSTVGGSECDDQ